MGRVPGRTEFGSARLPILVVEEDGKSCQIFLHSEIGPDFASTSTTCGPTDKWMRQADLAHQTGLETTLMDFLIVGRGVITAPRSGISNVGRNLASEQRENLDFGIASQSENIQFRCRTKVDLSTYHSLRSPLYNLSPCPSPLGAGRTNLHRRRRF